jgi:hypothetical protein
VEIRHLTLFALDSLLKFFPDFSGINTSMLI